MTAKVLAALLLAALPAAAAEDGEVARKIQDRLDRSGVGRQGDVTVRVERGKAVLDGAVATVYARTQAEKAARKESRMVENRLRVVPEQRSDKEIADAAQDAVLGYVWYTVFDSVGLGVENGVVRLTGSVLQPYRRSEIEERIARLAGVRAVHNEIQVQSVSTFDDQLRLQLYRAIYGSDRFVNFSRANPPVRIVVDRGHVTLTGVVGTNVERALLGSIARSTLAFEVNNRVEIESERSKESKRDAYTD